MPTILTHAVVAVGLARLLPKPLPVAVSLLGAGVAILPDVDVLAWPLGLARDSAWAHRGLTHSLPAAAVTAAALALAARRWIGVGTPLLAAYLLAAMASHGLLDAATNGGWGVAFWAPFDMERHFFAWRPVEVSPIGWSFVGRRGLAVLWSELRWIWLPLAAVITTVEVVRSEPKASGSAKRAEGERSEQGNAVETTADRQPLTDHRRRTAPDRGRARIAASEGLD
ncbi:MAG: metal-dependent hydrolase [Candidatus Rokuibacteriota bacterium]